MEKIQNTKVHWSFWIISSMLLLWNLLGCINFIAQLDPAIVMRMPETHRAMINGRAWWITGGFALTVFGGSIGCLLLLLKRAFAYYVFIASLMGVLIQFFPNLKLVGTIIVNPIDILMMMIMPPAIAIFLVIYSRSALRKNWII